MTPGEFAAIEARAMAATGGPWTWTEHRVPTLEGVVPSEFYSYNTEVLDATHSGECGCRSACELELEVSPADAEFIAHARDDIPTLLAAMRELQGELKAAVELHRDLTGRLGYGDNITEPQADNSTVVEEVDNLRTIERDHWECPRICEQCGEKLAATVCEHCHGGGCLPNAEMGYLECDWCAGLGRVHVGCAEESYIDLAAAVRERDNTIARVREVADKYASARWRQTPLSSAQQAEGMNIAADAVLAALDPQETP